MRLLETTSTYGQGLIHKAETFPNIGTAWRLCFWLTFLALLSMTLSPEQVRAVPQGDALYLDGIDDYVDISEIAPVMAGKTSFTVELWMKGERFIHGNFTLEMLLAVDSADGANTRLHLLTKGDMVGYHYGTSGNIVPDGVAPFFMTNNDAWHHYAYVRDDNTASFYIDGVFIGNSTTTPNYTFSADDKWSIGQEWDGANTSDHFRGYLDGVRIWDHARSAEQILFSYLPGPEAESTTGLVADWNFDNMTGGPAAQLTDSSGNGHDGILVNYDPSDPNTIAATGANPEAAGLWLGQIELDQVSDVTSATPQVPSPTAKPFDMNILLHVDAGGQVRLLREVTMMRQKTPTTNEAGDEVYEKVLLTDDSRLAEFTGISSRNGEEVGIRLGSLGFDFSAGLNELELTGGIGAGLAAAGSLDLAKDHPTNPFRHRYHPGHVEGMDIFRSFLLNFNDSTDLLDGGKLQLTGIYQEMIIGLHKVPIRLQGSFSLQRLSLIDELNPAAAQ